MPTVDKVKFKTRFELLKPLPTDRPSNSNNSIVSTNFNLSPYIYNFPKPSNPQIVLKNDVPNTACCSILDNCIFCRLMGVHELLPIFCSSAIGSSQQRRFFRPAGRSRSQRGPGHLRVIPRAPLLRDQLLWTGVLVEAQASHEAKRREQQGGRRWQHQEAR